MKWFSLPFFLVVVVVYRYVFDLLVGLAVSPAFAWLTKSASLPEMAPDSVCSVHQVAAIGTCTRCGRFGCSLCLVDHESNAMCVECVERVAGQSSGWKRGNTAINAVLLSSFFVRGLPVGVAIAIGCYLRPERWFVVWLIAAIVAMQPGVTRPVNRKQVIEAWTARVVASIGVAFGAFFPGLMPEFVRWIARRLVF